LGEVAYNEAQVEVDTLDNSIAMAKLELTKLANEQKAMFEELHEMQKAGGMSF
jgi:phage-related minor tail protein